MDNRGEGFRSKHLLRSHVTSQNPYHFIFFDTETQVIESNKNLQIHTLRMGWACYHRYRGEGVTPTEHWIHYTKAIDFWRFVFDNIPKKVTVWIVAHNLSFDFTILNGFYELGKRKAKLDFIYSNQSVTIIVANVQGRRVVCMDSLNLLPTSIEKLGQYVGLEKMKVNPLSCSDDDCKAYCKRDVEILRAAFLQYMSFIRRNKFGTLAYTTGSQAFNLFRFRFNNKQIYIHENEDICRLERRCYFGGRTECWRLGDLSGQDLYSVDVNSMYPYVMQSNVFPARLVNSGFYTPVKHLHAMLQRHAVCADVVINTNEPVYACRTEKTLFPIGQFHTSLTTPELKYALEHNHIIKVLRWSEYETEDLFSTYVTKIVSLRRQYQEEGNKLYEIICKLLGNSLYGKFGQKRSIWETIGNKQSTETYWGRYVNADTGKSGIERCIFGEVSIEIGETESMNSFPAISAHVTAFGRMMLWGLIQAAGRKEVVYMDTDSLVITKKGFVRLKPRLDPLDLGALKLVSSLSDLRIYGAKDYVQRGIAVIKGVTKTSKKLSENVYECLRFPKLRTILRNGYQGKYPVETFKKTLKRIYTKGTILKSGFVAPIELYEEE